MDNISYLVQYEEYEPPIRKPIEGVRTLSVVRWGEGVVGGDAPGGSGQWNLKEVPLEASSDSDAKLEYHEWKQRNLSNLGARYPRIQNWRLVRRGEKDEVLVRL
ncbi:MAG: hypothetical protein KGI60_02690 [Patescibacteria group bacterium]|nr:hypothetical protein [Patescibacteria group bacterium]